MSAPAALPAPHTQQARYAAAQHEQAQHAAALKVALLEEQAAAAAESARKRMQEQLDTFRGDAATARQAGVHAVCGAFCPPLNSVRRGIHACLPRAAPCLHAPKPPTLPALSSGRCAPASQSWSSSWMQLARRRQQRQTAAVSWMPPASGCSLGSRRRLRSRQSSASSSGVLTVGVCWGWMGLGSMLAGHA